jgi:hypothetical protein
LRLRIQARLDALEGEHPLLDTGAARLRRRCQYRTGSHAAVSRIWRAFSLQPHRVGHFKLSKDPLFVDKVKDIVGLYLDPPERAAVFCIDEKSQIQAPDRSAPGNFGLDSNCVEVTPGTSPAANAGWTPTSSARTARSSHPDDLAGVEGPRRPGPPRSPMDGARRRTAMGSRLRHGRRT